MQYQAFTTRVPRYYFSRQIFLLLFFSTSSMMLFACQSPAEEPQTLAGSEAAVLEIPVEGPASEKLITFIESIRTGNRDTVKALIRDNMAGFLQEIPVEDHVNQLMDFHDGFSQITFHGYVKNTPTAATGLFYNKHMDSWVNIGVELEKEAPHGIVSIILEPADAPE